MASIRKRNNSYQLIASLSVNGLPERRYDSWDIPEGMTPSEEKKEAQRLADEFEKKLKRGYGFNPTMTFSEYRRIWERDYADEQHRKTTKANEQDVLDRIEEYLGKVRMSKLDHQHIKEFMKAMSAIGVRKDGKYICKVDINTILKERNIIKKDFVESANIAYCTFRNVLNGKPVSNNTVKIFINMLGLKKSDFELVNKNDKYSKKTLLNFYRLVSKMLSDAVEWKIITDNPCSSVKAPNPRKKRVDYLDDVETQEFVAALFDAEEPYRTAIMLLLYLGCRRGELCGLHWDDINFRRNLVEINKSLLYTKEEGLFLDDTKTEESDRIIEVPASMIDMLIGYKEWQDAQRKTAGDLWEETGFIFTNKIGGSIRPDSLTSWIRKFCDKKSLKKVTIKGLRHTSATLLIMSGLNVRSLANRLGHAKTSTTIDIYSHAIKSMDSIAASMLDNVIIGQKPLAVNPNQTRAGEVFKARNSA